jgi:sialate O-acetylesterase
VASVFADHAVLQRDVALPVWGSAEAGVVVSVRLAGQVKTGRADPNGRWSLTLSPLKIQATGLRMTVQAGEETRVFHDLLVGEVWYCSGQSNMQMTLAACARRIESIRTLMARPHSSDIRMLRVGDPDAEHPRRDRPATTPWQIDTPASRGRQSAVAYFFARRLHERLGVPIGIIDSSWGGKPIEGFIPREAFEQSDILRPLLALADQNDLEALGRLEGGVIVRNSAGLPGRIFNGRVAPIAPYPLRGFLWYQGESNAGAGEDPRNYRHKMKALIEGWRHAWGQAELPFYFVQLPAFANNAHGWVRLREEQRRSLDLPHTGMAVTIDLRDQDIHPANKVDVGERLARWALAQCYGQTQAFSGPLFKSATIKGREIRVTFSHVGSGLMVASKEGLDPPQESSNPDLAHFELANESGQWFSANAKIVDDAVLVRSVSVLKPVAVRYACQAAPANANLYNRSGLPAAPFCSRLEYLPWQGSK